MRILTTIFILLFAVNSQAQTTYYVSTSGSDANNGTSTATPFKSIQKAKTVVATMVAGDRMRFKRGDIFDYNNEISYFNGMNVTVSGNSSAYITFDAYGTGARPKFRDRQVIPGWQTSANWTNRGTNRWAIYISGIKPIDANNRCRVWINSIEVGTPDPASATPTAVTSLKKFAIATDSLYIYSVGNPSTTYTLMEKSNSAKRIGFAIVGANYIKVSNLDIGSSAKESMTVIGSSNIIVDSCNLGWDGVFSPITVYTSTTGAISNCMINSGYKIQNLFTAHVSEDGISLNQGTMGWDCYNDSIINLGHSGFDFDNNGTGVIQNNKVRNCYISSPDLSYSRAFAYNAGDGASGNKIYDNYFYKNPTSSQISAPGVDVYNNIFDLTTKPIYRPSSDRAGAALAIVSYNHKLIKNVNIYNNTIINSQNMAFDIEGRNTDSIVDVRIINNLLYNNATGGQEQYPYQIYFLDHNPIVARITVRNNIIYKPGESILIFYSPNSVQLNYRKTVAQFNATDGIDGNIINGNINQDPLLNSDYSLKPASPAIAAGIDVGLPYSGVAPDIGAVSYSGAVALPIINAGSNKTITIDSTSVLATVTWANSHTGTVSWTKISGGTATITSFNSLGTWLKNLATGVYVFRCTATQDDAQTAYSEITITVTLPPTVYAGVDQSITIATVTLTGTATDAGTITSTLWTKIGGNGTITSPSSTSTTVTGLANGNYKFKFTATNNNSLSKSDTMQLVVNMPPPTVNAGSDQSITINNTSLSGSVSDAGTITAYLWKKISGNAMTFSSASTIATNITGLTTGTYKFSLTATSSSGLSSSDTVQINVNIPYPTVNAGIDQSITTSTTTLTGTASDAGSISSYKWDKISGGSVTIASSTSASTGISGLGTGVYKFRLTATNNNGLSTSDTMQVTVAIPIPAPTVSTVDKTITVYSTTISATATIVAGHTATYKWTQISGPSATISNSTLLTANVIATGSGVYVFRILVTQDDAQTAYSDLTLTVNIPVAAPTVSTTDKSITTDSTTLTAFVTSASTYTVTYLWVQTGGVGVTISDNSILSPKITGFVSGTYKFRITVTQSDGQTAYSDLIVTVAIPNIPPIANAGGDQILYLPSNTTTFSGTATPAVGHSIESVEWRKVSGGTYGMTGAGTLTPTVTLGSGAYEFALDVKQDDGLTATDTKKVTLIETQLPSYENLIRAINTLIINGY